jgi:hypothetical protein
MEAVNMLKLYVFLLTAVCILLTAGCAKSPEASQSVSPATLGDKQDVSRWLIPRNLVETTDAQHPLRDLKIVWQFNLPLDESEELDRLFISDNRLCGLSSRNYLSCLNRADGNVIFSGYIAPKGLPLVGMNCFKGEMITVVGNKLLQISADFGTEKTSTEISSGAACPVVRNDSFFYIAGIDKRLHVLKADNKVKLFEVAAENDSLITSVLADQEFVVFATQAGNVICITPDRPVKLWQFDAPAAVVPPVVHDTTSLYFACADTKVYRLDLASGRLLWKYQTQDILDAAPQIGARVVYQYVPDFGLIALDKETGKLLWKLPDGVGLLAESGDNAFVIAKAGLLTVMDNVKAKPLYSIDVGVPIKFASNTLDSKIYVADAKGRLACLEPVK